MHPHPYRSALVLLLSLALPSALAVPAAGQVHDRVEPHFGGVAVEPADAGGDAADAKAAFVRLYDDGEADITAKTASDTFEVAMLFDGVGGPDVTLGSVDFCWRQNGGDPKIRYEVVLWLPDGPGGAPGTEIATFAAVAEGVTNTPAFYGTSLGVPLDETDVYIGVRYNPAVDPDFWFCIDTDGLDGAPAQPGFFRSNEVGAWTPMQNFGGGIPAYKALMVRAFLSTPPPVLESLLLPFFEVDTTSPGGTTTLFAVRNLTANPVRVDLEVFDVEGTSVGTDVFNLTAFDTQTANLRDAVGLPVDPDGFARGYLRLFAAGNPDGTPVMAGDYFQVTVDEDFATGDKLVREFLQVCQRASLRFVDFGLPGSGTRLNVWIRNPRGEAPADPASFTVRVLDEEGNQVGGVTSIKTDQHALELAAEDFTGIPFGTLQFDFGPSNGGTVYSELSAEDRFSVGLASQCDEVP